jgi:membrane protein
MRLSTTKQPCWARSVICNHTVAMYIPVPDLFNQILDAAARAAPPEGMGLVRGIVGDVIVARRGALLSLGLLGSLWTVSSGFSALIEALDVAYDVPETRSWWDQRLLSLGMALVVALLSLVALAVMLVGPRFGDWLPVRVGVGPELVAAWPIIRWGVAIGFTVRTYFLLPNVKQSFKQSLPGALVAVGVDHALLRPGGLFPALRPLQ